jgi:hypothetical protein
MLTTAAVLVLVSIVTAGVAQGAQAKSWKKVVTLSGASDVSSAPFMLKGGQQKVTGQVTADPDYPDMWVAGWFVHALKGYDDASIEADETTGVIATRLYLHKGRHYIEAMSANCSWTITLWEKR